MMLSTNFIRVNPYSVENTAFKPCPIDKELQMLSQAKYPHDCIAVGWDFSRGRKYTVPRAYAKKRYNLDLMVRIDRKNSRYLIYNANFYK